VYVRVLIYLLNNMRNAAPLPLYAANIVGNTGKWVCPFPWFLKFLPDSCPAQLSCDLKGVDGVYTVNGGGGHIFNSEAIAAFAGGQAIDRCIKLMETSEPWANTPSDTTIPICYALVTANYSGSSPGQGVGSLYRNLQPILDQSRDGDASWCCGTEGNRATCHYQSPTMMHACHEKAEVVMGKDVRENFELETNRTLEEWAKLPVMGYNTLLHKPQRKCAGKCSASAGAAGRQSEDALTQCFECCSQR
jgi:hypothetical protein